MTTLKVYRWAPGAPERVDAFEVAPREGLTVLDALVEVQRGTDPTLAFRYACRVGMCGSCAMVVDGRERWACRTLVARLGAAVTVRPLYHFPLIRDLVVDMTPFTARMRLAGAAFAPSDRPAPEFAAVRRDSAERRAIDAAVECIGCGMCLSACTMVGHNPRFPGPAALNRAFTLQMDSRDTAHGARAGLLLSEDALLRCHTQSTCTEVWPMGLSPTESILALRRRAALGLVA
jgi:fumarate reductase iron-sulfur subunit